MREYKFRAKTNVNIEEVEHIKIEHDGSWVFGTYLDGFIVDGVAEATDEYIALEFWCPIDIDTVGQYTGLKDKNGVEIYEGDILEDEEHYRREVTQIDGGWAIECNDMPGMQCLTMAKTEWYEVIGNIHENPVLESGE